MIKNTLLAALLTLSAGCAIVTDNTVSVNTLGNSAKDLSPFKAQQGGLYLAPDYHAVLPRDTKLLTSTRSWVDANTNTVDLSKLPRVSGSVTARDITAEGSVLVITSDANYRYFKGNGLPTTVMGQFPVEKGTEAYTYYSAAPAGHDPRTGIPGSDYSSAAAIGVSPYDVTMQLPRNPKYSTVPNPIAALPTGIALTGAVWHAEIANASATQWYNPVSILPLDQCFGHPYSQQYHYHAYSWRCFPHQGTAGHSPLFGYALDGFGIYGPQGDDGEMVTNSQLDQCHGHIGTVLWDGKLTEIYHYHLNNQYPYSIGCFRGVVDYDKALGSSDLRSHANMMHGASGMPPIPQGPFQ